MGSRTKLMLELARKKKDDDGCDVVSNDTRNMDSSDTEENEMIGKYASRLFRTLRL